MTKVLIVSEKQMWNVALINVLNNATICKVFISIVLVSSLTILAFYV
jgi:hypothetical protein